MSPIFLLAATVLVLVTLAFLLLPLLKKRNERAANASRQALNSAIYRDQLEDLEKDRAAGTLAQAEYDQSRQDLQRRLLEDAKESDAVAVVAPSRRTAIVLSLFLPLAAAGMYYWLGTPAGLSPAAPRPSVPTEMVQKVNDMVAKLEAKLQQNPDNPKGWAMLARSYKALGRFDDSERAFTHLTKELESDPEMLMEYADMMAAKAQGKLAGKPTELAAKALKLDPQNGMALMMSGSAAYQRNDIPATIGYLERLQKIVPPGSQDATTLKRMLDKLRRGEPLDEEQDIAEEAPAPNAPAGPAPSGGAETITGRATLAPSLGGQVQPGDTVFVFARPVNGSRMPLAIVRARASDLPLNFTLDDSQSMSPQAKLSQASEVKVEVRVSRSGDAMAKSGDLTGELSPVKPGSKDLQIKIDKVLP